MALELARHFSAAGRRVIVAESLRFPITRASRAVARSYRVPPPRQDPEGYIAALLRIIRRERASWLLPTCEELFAVARGRDALQAAGCRVLCEPLPRLDRLHHKGRFIAAAAELGLAVPETRALRSPEDLAALDPARPGVVKPAYSRFGAAVLFLPEDQERLSELAPSPQRPWLWQERLRGRQLCCYAVAEGGRLRAYADYESVYRAGVGACVHFRALGDAAMRAWVAAFVAGLELNGQLAFDFIEGHDGAPRAIECNPRATSGLHLFRPQDGRLARAFLGGSEACVSPRTGASAMLAAPMLLMACPGLGRLRGWIAALMSTPCAVLRGDDPLPFFFQFATLGELAATSLREGIGVIEASTHDIEWNGEGE